MQRERAMNENEISGLVLDTCIQIHRDLGPGLFESVYERVLSFELSKHDLEIQTQVPINIQYHGLSIERAFIADLIIDKKVVVELKSVEKITDLHKKQLLTYLKLTKMRLGLLINFNEILIKDGFLRIANKL